MQFGQLLKIFMYMLPIDGCFLFHSILVHCLRFIFDHNLSTVAIDMTTGITTETPKHSLPQSNGDVRETKKQRRTENGSGDNKVRAQSSKW